MLKGCIATCIVCIDDFAVGSKMRILPCGHNYHIECIDPWLTSKSSLCPLCK
ncbi:ring finger protein 13, partial [Coemansia reversa NRRL 1564]